MTNMKCGHTETDSNVKYYKKRDGYVRKVCVECKNRLSRAQRRVGYISEVKARRKLDSMPVDTDAPRRFEIALERAANDPEAPQPDCITPIGEPSKWIDWATNEEEREAHESEAPSRQEARIWCEDCPLLNVCTAAALAKRPYHGVRGSGLIFENGKRI